MKISCPYVSNTLNTLMNTSVQENELIRPARFNQEH